MQRRGYAIAGIGTLASVLTSCAVIPANYSETSSAERFESVVGHVASTDSGSEARAEEAWFATPEARVSAQTKDQTTEFSLPEPFDEQSNNPQVGHIPSGLNDFMSAFQPESSLLSIESSTSSVGTEPDSPDAGETPSSEVVIDPDAGGSSEVVYPDPAEAEVPKSSKAAALLGLSITSLGETSVTAVFEPTAGATKYLAYLRHGDSFSSKGLGAETTVSFVNLTPDWDYTLCVSYYFGVEESIRTCLDLHTLGSRPVEPEPPTAPSNVRLQAMENSISVAWDEVAGATGYRVCHVHGDNSWHCGGYRQLSTTSVIFDDGSIFPATLYGVTVVAVDENGRSSKQAVAYVTTPGAAPVEPELLPAPENIRIEAIDAKTVKVFWDYSSGDVISVWTVKIRRLTSYSSIGVSGDARSFVVENLYSATGYEVILSGRDASGRWTYEAKQGFYTPAG